MRRLHLLPHSLAWQMILLLTVGFAAIRIVGLFIDTTQETKLEQLEEADQFAKRAAVIYLQIAEAAPADRAALLAKEPLEIGETASLADAPPLDGTLPLPSPTSDAVRLGILDARFPPVLRPHHVVLRFTTGPDRLIVSFGLPADIFALFPYDMPLPPQGGPPPPPEPFMNMLAQPLSQMLPPSSWLTLTAPFPRPEPWRSSAFIAAFTVVTLLGAALIIWAVYTLLYPLRLLAGAAERLGRDVTASPPLPETGPVEIATAARAFNTMAARIRRFVEDRTFMLTAIGHDLRTPITRLRLRAEYMDDEEQRIKMLADLDEMEAMVAATLAFGRDVTTSEAAVRLDLASLLRTILDDAADGAPEQADALAYSGPDHLAVSARPLALKRALANLIGNALKYGGAARVLLTPPARGMVRIEVEDDGPGIPPAELETVFEPFHRLESSRNRETGGSGLGLSIVRNIIRAHGGDITLTNRPSGGLRATLTLPA